MSDGNAFRITCSLNNTLRASKQPNKPALYFKKTKKQQQQEALDLETASGSCRSPLLSDTHPPAILTALV